METPLLYRQLQDQLSQWVQPKDQRHLQGFAEIVAAVLQSGEACLGRWIPYLSHRDCGARAHMERLSYFLHNPQITAERYYEPILPTFRRLTNNFRYALILRRLKALANGDFSFWSLSPK